MRPTRDAIGQNRMRRDNKEITSRSVIDEIIRGCKVCHLGLAVDGEPYIVPVSFGYDGELVYFHTAREGKKIDFIGSNPRVCLEFERDVSLVTSDSKACKWTFSFESVIAYGTISELTGSEARSHGLNQIMRHYSGREWEFDDSVLVSTRIWGVTVETATGKRSEQKAT
jgi:nitroimidazol reductase NimA-like FMN-containing flavoprotein (pyridoxamine 5'-phosphate oxidase superfamily)